MIFNLSKPHNMNRITNQTAALGATEVRELIDRFLDAATTPAEEQELYAFFAAAPVGSLDSDLEALRPMFGWYAGLAETSRQREPKSWWARSRKRIVAVASAAAVLAVMVAVGLGVFSKKSTPVDPLYASYEGSYIVRNGVRTNDLALIYATVAAAEHMADSLNSRADRELMADRDYDRQAIDEALSAISDPVLAAQLRHDLLD